MSHQNAQNDPPAASPSSSRFEKAKVNAKYLALGNKAGVAPASFATKTALNTTRYALRYAIRRLIRYAKYAAVGAIVAALGGTLLGTLGSGIAFFAAPSIGVGMGIGVITAVAKFGWRHRGSYFRGGIFEAFEARAAEGRDPAQDERADAKQKGNNESHRQREDVWMRV